MYGNKVGRKIQDRKYANDRIYTPEKVAKMMINMCEIEKDDKVLDPSRGGGVFYNNLPECNKDWCEIDEGIDFFDYDKEVDIVLGNPPYSLWSKWLNKTTELNPKKICYIFNVANFTPKRIENLKNAGYGVKIIKLMKIDWWYSFSLLILFEKGYNSDNIHFKSIRQTVMCENCGKSRCGRGFKGKSFNKCPLA